MALPHIAKEPSPQKGRFYELLSIVSSSAPPLLSVTADQNNALTNGYNLSPPQKW